jgi:7-carboxy-7-deazaguanine synthase
MKVCEIFISIQGESSYAGIPFVFVRLSGCNLRCFYCDTTYAYDEGREMSVDEALEKVSSYGIKFVEITGGEPLLQKDSLVLIKRLLDDNYSVLVETNGSVSIKDVDRRAIIIMDIKTPKSGMFDKMNLDNLKYIKDDDEIKFVLADRKDYEWATNFIHEYDLINKCNILFSPVYGVLSPEKLAKWILDDRLPVRLNLQIHNFIFGNDKRGV